MRRTLTPANIRRIKERITALGHRTTESSEKEIGAVTVREDAEANRPGVCALCERDALRAEGENLHAKMREIDAANVRLRVALRDADMLAPVTNSAWAGWREKHRAVLGAK